jgi:outer membrane receptor protein involved in Fe transport
LGLTAINTVSAQVSTTPLTDTNGTNREAIVLSPFRVDGTSDVGYQATNSMAGTRLKTPLRDIGSAVSVLTKAVFDDTGATNADSILSYATGMEVGGELGNFADGKGSNSNGRAEQDVQRTNPQDTQRVRGLASASLTRDFFLTDIPFDSYNTGRVDISRGANSLLFGIGSPGGIINNDLNKAHADGKNGGEFVVRFGQQGSHRESLDYNHRVIANRLALRVSTLYSDTRFKQRPAFELDKRLYGAFEAVLFTNKNSSVLGRTVLRGNYEMGRIKANPVNILPPGDGISDWFYGPDIEALRHVPGVFIPGYLDPLKPTEPARVHPTINTITWEPKKVYDTRYGLSRATTPGVVERIVDRNVIIMFPQINSTAPVWGSAQGMTSTLSRNPATNIGPATGGRTFDFLTTMPFFGGNRNGQSVPNFTPAVIMDRGVWDNPNQLITGELSSRDAKFSAENLTLEQTFFKNSLGVELAYDKQSFAQESALPFSAGESVGDNNSGEIVIDVSEYLGNFQKNPNVGRPMMKDWGLPDKSLYETVRMANRATAFYDLNFKDVSKRWGWLLGRHTFTGVYNEQSIETLNKGYVGKWDNVAGSGSNIGSANLINDPLNGGFRNIVAGVYMGPSLLDSSITSPGQVVIKGPISIPLPKDGDIYSVDIWNRATQKFERTDVMAKSMLASGGRRRQEIDTEVFSWQGRLLNDSLILLYGSRKDTSRSYENIPPVNSLGVPERLPSGEINSARFILVDTASTEQSARTVTKSVVAHVPEKWLSRLPFSISLHASESENFQPNETRNSILGETLSPPSGTTKEMGFSLELLDRRVTTRLNWYETTSNNSSIALGTASGVVTWGAPAPIARWQDAKSAGLTIDQALVIAGGTPGMFKSYEEIYQRFIGWLPKEIQDLRNIRVENGVVVQNPNPGEAATQDFVSTGFEGELVANVTKNWRVSLNVAQQKAITSNTATEHSRVAAEIFAKMSADPVGKLQDTPNRTENQTFIQRYASNVTAPLAAIKARDNALALELREWRMNFITNYNFTVGKLRGFGAGGALRWQSGNAVGYPNIIDEFKNVVPDLDRPFMGPAQTNGDIWLSYKRKLKGPLNWVIQLNVRNAAGSKDYIPVIINPDGKVAVVRNPNPTTVFVTNTFKF